MTIEMNQSAYQHTENNCKCKHNKHCASPAGMRRIYRIGKAKSGERTEHDNNAAPVNNCIAKINCNDTVHQFTSQIREQHWQSK